MKGKAPALGITEITQLIPHRYPMLMVDRVVEQFPGGCVAIKNVTANECYFPGHFPDKQLMPGCLLQEAMAQAGNFIGGPVSETKLARVEQAWLLSSQAKFLLPVQPGDQIVITARLVKKAKDVIRFKSSAHVDGQKVASGTFLVRVRREGEASYDWD